MSKNGDYWKQRFEQMENSRHNVSKEKAYQIQEQFDKAQHSIESKINAWYQRYADNNSISLLDARKELSAKERKELQWDVNDYIKYGRENAIDQKWVKQLENASAKAHVSRLEAVELQCQQSAEEAFGNYSDNLASHVRDTYKNDYYHTAYEVQKGTGVGCSFAGINNDKLDKVISKPWSPDGKNFSERIWSNKSQLIDQLHTSLTQMCIVGNGPDRAIKEIASAMNASKINAGRVVMTESAYFGSEAQKDCFNELDVERYEIVATIDGHTSDICQDMDGQVFKMSEFEEGVTAPPFHVNCRSCTCPYFDDEFDSVGERAARGEDGETYYVPEDMTYKEWQKSFVDGNKSGLQEVKSNEWQNRKFAIDDNQQNYLKIETDGNLKEWSRYQENILTEKLVGTKNSMYISQNVKLKPKELHMIDNSIETINSELDTNKNFIKPTIVVASSTEMGERALAAYNAKSNVLFVNKVLGNKEKAIELQKGFAASNNPLSTYYHELWHWRDAQEYIAKYGTIKSQADYIQWIRRESKKKIDKLIKKGYNINNISDYSDKSLIFGFFDEVFTEYRVKERLR